ncbi:hypothetical protein BaRGS_00020362 [Batillaria attramentaria]|uniref:Secreted protein n=1 Tax=Batillaria attramentaria TaxID=370345 RepID=A0ABD0KMX2_9CAEN
MRRRRSRLWSKLAGRGVRVVAGSSLTQHAGQSRTAKCGAVCRVVMMLFSVLHPKHPFPSTLLRPNRVPLLAFLTPFMSTTHTADTARLHI